MMAKLKDEEEKLKKAESTIAVMTMLKEGTVPETVAPIGEESGRAKQPALSARQGQLDDSKGGNGLQLENLPDIFTAPETSTTNGHK